MNKYLDKVAESLPYRLRSEVLIHKDGKVLLTVNPSESGVWHGLPGGGVEEGQTPEEAAIAESLEEVGIKVKNLRDSGETQVKEGYLARKGQEHRQTAYRGSKTHLFEADFDAHDASNLAEDAVKYAWMTPAEAHRVLSKRFKETGYSGHQVKALEKYLK